MILLDATTKTLQVSLASSATTNNCPWVVSYGEYTVSTMAVVGYNSSDGVTNGASAATAVTAPSSGNTRKVQFLSVFNADTVATTVSVTVNNNGTLRTIFVATLQVGEQLVYQDSSGFAVYDSTGQTKFLGAYPSSVTSAISAFQAINANTYEPTGFLGQSDSTISFNYSTLTFTIAPVSGTFTLYMRGTLYAKSTETVVLPSTSGTYYIYYNSSAVLTQSTTVWDIAAGLAPVAVVYLNTTMGAAWLAEERHNCIMDWATHKNLHFTQGTKLESGGTASGYVLNTAADGANTYAVAATTIADEDIILSLSGLADAGPYCLWYPSGAVGSAGLWLWNTTNVVPFLYQSGGYIQYSQLSGSTWSLTQLTSGQYVNYYLIATNYQGQAAYILIPGQAVYTSLFAALAETPASLNLAGLPILEWVMLARFTYAANSNNGSTGYVQTVNAQQYLISNVLLLSAINPANHSVLSNRSDASSHPAAAIAVDVTQFGGALGPTDTTVQQALQDLSVMSEPNAAAPSSDAVTSDHPHSRANFLYSQGYNAQAQTFAASRWL